MSKNYLLILIIILLGGAVLIFAEAEPLNFSSEGSGAEGVVLIGPQCPVVMEGEECPDKTYKTRLSIRDPQGLKTIKEFDSDENGIFKVNIRPGEYSIHSAAAAEVLPYCISEQFEVRRGEYTKVSVFCDSGIR